MCVSSMPLAGPAWAQTYTYDANPDCRRFYSEATSIFESKIRPISLILIYVIQRPWIGVVCFFCFCTNKKRGEKETGDKGSQASDLDENPSNRHGPPRRRSLWGSQGSSGHYFLDCLSCNCVCVFGVLNNKNGPLKHSKSNDTRTNSLLEMRMSEGLISYQIN